MKQTKTILDSIVAAKKEYLVEQKRQVPEKVLLTNYQAQVPANGSSFFEALKTVGTTPKIIAEVKRASPSAGTLREPFDLSQIIDSYQNNEHVVAISVLTEQTFFKGSDEDLAFAVAHNPQHKPILRKDFIIDRYQIIETKLLGADAYLLLASLFDFEELVQLINDGQALGLEPLIEVTNQAELDMALATKATCIGVNSRNLRTFEHNLQAHELLKAIPNTYAKVAESGITNASYLQEVSSVADAALIGSHFMQANNISQAIERLISLEQSS